jgi:hypothetical protein
MTLMIMVKKKGWFYLFDQDYHVNSAGCLPSSGTHIRSHRRMMIVVHAVVCRDRKKRL